ncbi:MAG: pilus assembly protein [Desulfobulbaceae bacterium]|nr:pilus assembly protein [Desulfobulbaceae bacterium]
MIFSFLRTEHREKGASLIEFALILPLLLVVLFGIIEFGFILYDQAMLTNAAREGARFGVVARAPRHSVDEIRNEVNTYCATYLVSFGGPVSPVVTVTPDPTATALFGDDLTVSVTFRYTFLFVPNFVPGLPQGKDLSATVVMKCE